MYEIREITGATVEKVFPLMKELRTNLDPEKYMRVYEEARQRDGYRLYGLIKGDVCQALMGARILVDFVHGRHLYIDDLVVTKDLRGGGLGAMLLKHAIQIARAESCEGLRLCTGIDNQDGRRFYEREGWSGRAIAYKLKL